MIKGIINFLKSLLHYPYIVLKGYIFLKGNGQLAKYSLLYSPGFCLWKVTEVIFEHLGCK